MTPTTLDEAVAVLCGRLPDEVQKFLRLIPPEAVDGYVSEIRLGRRLGLQDETNALHQWFRRELQLWDPADMGVVILDAVARKVRGEARRTDEIIARCRKHWSRLGIDPYTGRRVRPMPSSFQFTPPRTIFNN